MFYYTKIIKRSKHNVRIKLINGTTKLVSWNDLLKYKLYRPELVPMSVELENDLYGVILKKRLLENSQLYRWGELNCEHIYKKVNININDEYIVYGMKKPY